jgi:hypothetical protein
MSDINEEPRENPLNKWWLASGIFMVLVAAVLGFILFGPSDAPPPPTAVTPTTTQGQPTGSSTSAQAGDCVRQPSSDASPGAGLKTQWTIVDKVALPSTAAGPKIESPVRRCYAQSPEGALLAAANIGMTAFGQNHEDVFKYQVLPGPNHDAALREAREAKPREGDLAQIRGFRFLNYSSEKAQVQLLTGLRGTYQQFTITVQWVDNDWKVNLDTAGGYLPPQPASPADGFTQWSGV